MSSKLTHAPLLAAAFLLAAGAGAPAAQAQAGLAVGSCVIADKRHPGVITAIIQNGYMVRDFGPKPTEFPWPSRIVVAAPCPAAAAPAAGAPTAPKTVAAVAPKAPASQTPAPKTAAPKAAAAPGAAPRPGAYHCVFFINGSLQTVPGFTLAPGRYTHQNGGGGTTRVAGGVIEFVGGPLTGQAGKVEPNIVRLFNEARSRTVIDCSTKG
jgi:hypothetical protein